MFGFFNKKNKAPEVTSDVFAVTEGTWIDQKDLSDPTFNQGMMGPSWGIDSQNGEVIAPFDGTVTMVFPTGHALGLKRDDGLEQLIHIGIDTVTLNGKGFDMKVDADQHVRKGDLLVTFDPQLIRDSNLDPTVINVITSPTESLTEQSHDTTVKAGQKIFEAVPARE